MTKIYFAKTEFNNGTWSLQLQKIMISKQT